MSQSPDYQKGYAAGRRRLEKEIKLKAVTSHRNEHWLKFYTAVLPAASVAQGWANNLKDGTKQPITNIPDRVSLASDFADEALKHAIRQGKIL